jgi:hypothetical protein
MVLCCAVGWGAAQEIPEEASSVPIADEEIERILKWLDEVLDVLPSPLSSPQPNTNVSTARGMATQELRDDGLCAAHRSLPLGSKVKVTNAVNGKEIEVIITMRIPLSSERIIDLSPGAALALDIGFGGPVVITVIRQ